MTKGSDFYDEEDVFNIYMRARDNTQSANDTLEEPAFLELLGDFKNATILDLGCGDGRFGQYLLQNGCQSYTGIEPSKRMVERAENTLIQPNATIYHQSMEAWQYPNMHFDIVLSRLALHYVDDIASVFEQVCNSLKPQGRFIFSVEHPIITSYDTPRDKSGKRQQWIVDNYFATGKRNVKWMNSEVTKYHRTIEDYFVALQKANFLVEQLREPRPEPERFEDKALYERRQRIPLFLLFSAKRLE